ncbi:dermonecrotic toxin domain-containing protein [Pseudomonas fluorescens]|uniref:leucine-rich repeat domain-containing protein n=1 Tax=Pseudomonas fluorescens TaxID=294 RepID=UPI0005FB27D5|nr:DUF6543 domain-containing protein [Pseudomonas fluorescens]KJZ35703.1 hypothetical protein VC33_18590 [Pseudomonas fluorescens]
MNQDDFEPASQPDSHFHHVYQNLPAWLLESSTETRGALKSASLEAPPWHRTASRLQHQVLKSSSQTHWTERNRLGSMLAKVQNAQDYAEPILASALKTRFDLELDVKTTFLRLYIPLTTPWFAIKTGAARTWTVSMLDAALHNFQPSEAEVGAYEADSTFISAPSPTGQFDTLPEVSRKLTIQAFTQLCRELDIGGQYNAYLKDNLGLTNRVAGAVLKSKVGQTNQAALRSALKLAHARRDIEDDAYNAIERLLEARAPMPLDGYPLHCHDLTMMSSSLTGIIVFSAKSSHTTKATRIIAYIPDDPEHPLKQYPDTVAFMNELTHKLHSPAYQAFFSRFVDHHERGYFFADLNRRLQAVTWHRHTRGDPLPSWRETPIDHPNLRFSMTPFRAGLWNHLYQRQLNKILNDASTVAVSTARADQNARWAMWDAFSKVASAVLEVATFVALPFVPFLGELMLAYMAYQVLDETFEGIVDWAEDQKTEAFRQLMSVVETVVQTGTFVIGSAIAARTFQRLLSPESVALIEPLKPVPGPDGKTRYWNPDLTRYEQTIDLPAGLQPDDLGLYRHENKTLLPLEGKLYAVQSNARTGAFKIEHPDRVDAYQPTLRHNGHGAWTTELEQPLSWDRDTVMHRLGHSVESFSRAEREAILRISGYHDNVLREIHVENHRPPSLLTDTIKRFKIDRDIQNLIDQNHTEHPDYDRALSHRKSLFESRYRALEKTTDRPVQVLQANTQGLPTDIAQELASNASGTELTQLHNGTVPQRLKDVALKAMEAVRITRAYEGLFRDALETADTHQLALHSLNTLPDWPTDLRLEVRDFSQEGALRDSMGRVDAPNLKTLVRTVDGSYRLHDNDATPGDFYHTLFQALPDTERTSIGDSRRFKQRLAEHALEQPGLRTLFAKNPHRKPFYDPTTMRLPGGTEGYTRRVGMAPTLDDRVREVYPSLNEEELRSMVLRLQRHPDGARFELSRLASELARLRQDLNGWVLDAPTTDAETGFALNDMDRQIAQRNRKLLAREIQRAWRRQTDRELDSEDGVERYVLTFVDPVPGDLPTLNADFNHVSTLSLEGHFAPQGIPAFLEHFKGLRRLELRRFHLSTLPDAIPRMTSLDALVLSDCGINFDAANWSKLQSLNKLSSLDLYRNSIEGVPSLESMPDLVQVDLSDTGLSKFPRGAFRSPHLESLMLLDNKITDLPTELFDSAVYEKQGVYLTHNPLSNAARQLIKQQYFSTSFDLGAYAPEADIVRVRALYPGMEVEQASEFVYDLPGTLEDGRIELTRLEQELSQLQVDLSTWTANLPPYHPLTGEPFTALQEFFEHSSRDELKHLLEQCWRKETELDEFDSSLEPGYELVIRSPVHGELPTLSANFDHVSSVELQSADGVTRIGRFLESFPKLKNLRLRYCNLGEIPEAVFKMGQLRSLSLPHCRVRLTTDSVSALAAMEQLEYLDLGYNRLEQAPDLSQMSSLETILLNDTGITELPHGLMQMSELEWADLSANAITEVPSEILELPLKIAENINFRGNRFSVESLSRLVSYFERTGVDFGVEEIINQGQMEISTSGGSEVDE